MAWDAQPVQAVIMLVLFGCLMYQERVWLRNKQITKIFELVSWHRQGLLAPEVIGRVGHTFVGRGSHTSHTSCRNGIHKPSYEKASVVSSCSVCRPAHLASTTCCLCTHIFLLTSQQPDAKLLC
jgi:hypothetical protein